MEFSTLAYPDADELVFGRSRWPVACGLGMTIGAGEVIPEIKFAPRPGKERSREALRAEHRRMVTDALDRAVAVGLPSLMVELEHVFQLTDRPEWGAAVTADVHRILEQYHERHGIRLALRATVADIRRPEVGLRSSPEHEKIQKAFSLAAKNGADVLSIESIGGKEVFNHAVTRQDLRGVIFAIDVLGVEDMRLLWDEIVSIAREHEVVAGGDSDCAHANTAMFLAGGLLDRELSHSFAALVRVAGAVRSLVAFERGATGPDKDCGYEGIYLKAITGRPISMEGKTSACAHSDLMGNLAAAACDLWSNEAVAYGEMFGGTTPQVFTEMLGYDAALMNVALRTGVERLLRDLYVASDRYRDPQALVLSPREVLTIAERMVAETSHYRAAVAGVLQAAEIIREAERSGMLGLTRIESETLDACRRTLEGLPEDRERFVAECLEEYARKVPDFRPENYGILREGGGP